MEKPKENISKTLTKECQCYIKPICFTDIEEYNSFSSRCFSCDFFIECEKEVKQLISARRAQFA